MRAGLVFAVVLLVIFFGLFVGSCTVVDPGHVGVKVTMGSVSPNGLDAGLVFHSPFASIKEVNVQHQTTLGETPCSSKDLQIVTTKYAVQWRVPSKNVVKLYEEYKGDPQQTLVEPQLLDSLKKHFAMHNAEELVQKRNEVAQEALTHLRQSLGDLIEITELSIINIDLSDQLDHAIEAKMVKQQESLAKQYELDSARKAGEIKIVAAEAEAKSIDVTAQALAKSPAFVELEIIKKWNGVSPTTVVTEGGGAKVLLPAAGGSLRSDHVSGQRAEFRLAN